MCSRLFPRSAIQVPRNLIVVIKNRVNCDHKIVSSVLSMKYNHLFLFDQALETKLGIFKKIAITGNK